MNHLCQLLGNIDVYAERMIWVMNINYYTCFEPGSIFKESQGFFQLLTNTIVLPGVSQFGSLCQVDISS